MTGAYILSIYSQVYLFNRLGARGVERGVRGAGRGGQLGADQYLKSWVHIKGKEIEAIKPLIYILLR